MKNIFSILLLCAIVSFSVSCSEEASPEGPGTLTLHFDNVVGEADLKLDTNNTPYTNSKGEAYKLTTLRYYVSNIKAKREDGTVYADEIKSDGSVGYYLIDESDVSSQDVILKNVPPGNYTEVTFTIGVDANQVDQGAQMGVLDPAKGLFWSWNSGYIFMQVEGVSSVSTQADHSFQYHVGGYKDDPTNANSNLANNVKTFTLSFNGDSAPVKGGHEPEVHLLYDVNKFFNGAGESVTFATNASRHSPKACVNLANNIAGAFTVDHVHAN